MECTLALRVINLTAEFDATWPVDGFAKKMTFPGSNLNMLENKWYFYYESVSLLTRLNVPESWSRAELQSQWQFYV